ERLPEEGGEGSGVYRWEVGLGVDQSRQGDVAAPPGGPTGAPFHKGVYGGHEGRPVVRVGPPAGPQDCQPRRGRSTTTPAATPGWERNFTICSGNAVGVW